jgi:hypothetical protein
MYNGQLGFDSGAALISAEPTPLNTLAAFLISRFVIVYSLTRENSANVTAVSRKKVRSVLNGVRNSVLIDSEGLILSLPIELPKIVIRLVFRISLV